MVARIAGGAALALILAGCGQGERADVLRELAGGQDVRVRLSTGETRRDVTATVRPLAVGADMAIVLASYEVARHCLRWTGRSTAQP
jgi:hypothetical protein